MNPVIVDGGILHISCILNAILSTLADFISS